MLGCDMELRSTPDSFMKRGEFDTITGNGSSLPCICDGADGLQIRSTSAAVYIGVWTKI